MKELRMNWRIYLIEGWALGMFMVATCAFTILMEHPDVGVNKWISSGFVRRMITGVAMGITAILLVYSSWGKRSGAHMNPAFTLANWQMDRINTFDAIWYIVAQFTGGYLGVAVFQLLVPTYIGDPSVAYAVTVPAKIPNAEWLALLLEFILSFMLLFTVLLLSNHPRLSPLTGYFVGLLLFIYITFEAPYSGMSINPARTVASSLPAGEWTSTWVYFIGPLLGMLSAGILFRKLYRHNNGECQSMECFMSGNKNGNATYEVLKYTTGENAGQENNMTRNKNKNINPVN